MTRVLSSSLLALVLAACSGKHEVDTYKAQWTAVTESTSGQAEAERLAAFVEDLRSTGANYTVSLSTVSGREVPISEWHLQREPLVATIELGGQRLTWQPKDPENLGILLRE